MTLGIIEFAGAEVDEGRERRAPVVHQSLVITAWGNGTDDCEIYITKQEGERERERDREQTVVDPAPYFVPRPPI